MPEVQEKTAAKGSALASVLEKTTEQIPFNIEEEERLPGSRVRYKLKLTEEAIQARLNDTFKEFNRQVRIPGFRPGKAPIGLVKNRFEDAAREETVKRIVPRLAQLISEQKSVEPLGEPYLLDWKSSKADGTMVEMALEVHPEINVTEDTIQDLSVKAHRIRLDDDYVSAAIENLRKRNATFEPTEDGTFEKGDGLLFTCTVSDVHGNVIPDRSATDYYTTDVDNDFPQQIADALVGKKKGESISMDILDETENENVHYDLDVLEIKKRVLPKLDDSFAQDVSEEYETLDDLRKGVREQLEKSEGDRQREEALGEVYQVLASRLEFDLPRALVARTANRSVTQMERQLNQYGMSLKTMDAAVVNNYAANVQEQAKQNVRNFLILRRIGKMLGLTPSEEQINEALNKLAAQAGRKPLAVRGQLEARKEWDQFIEDLSLKLTNDVLMERASVEWEEVSHDKWTQIVEEKRQEQIAALEGKRKAAAEAHAHDHHHHDHDHDHDHEGHNH